MARPDLEALPKVRELHGLAADALPLDELMTAQQPAVLKGVARDWPMVRHGLEGADSAIAYLKTFTNGRPVAGYTGAPDIGGRYFYSSDFTALNFDRESVALDSYLDRMRASLGEARPPSFYVGSTDVDIHLPGFRAQNDIPSSLPEFQRHPPIASIWIGTRTVASAHFDLSNNLACSLVGKRRFTLFPPEQVANLYPGPLEPTPGGQVVSLVDFRAPDLDRFPLARHALAAAQVAEVEPGDLLFYPAMWWHQVEALAPFNVMVNYWWDRTPSFMDSPMTTMLHGMLSLRDRPEPEKQAWRALFDYYLFGPAERPAAHLPEPARGALGPLDQALARRLRAQILGRLNR